VKNLEKKHIINAIFIIIQLAFLYGLVKLVMFVVKYTPDTRVISFIVFIISFIIEIICYNIIEHFRKKVLKK